VGRRRRPGEGQEREGRRIGRGRRGKVVERERERELGARAFCGLSVRLFPSGGRAAVEPDFFSFLFPRGEGLIGYLVWSR